MPNLTKLPLSEFEIMDVIWDEPAPVPTHRILERLQGHKDWKPPTVLTLLSRLVGRGFLLQGKQGREGHYTPLVTRDDYVAFESRQFLSTFHRGSLKSFVAALAPGKALSDDAARELEAWLRDRGE